LFAPLRDSKIWLAGLCLSVLLLLSPQIKDRARGKVSPSQDQGLSGHSSENQGQISSRIYGQIYDRAVSPCPFTLGYDRLLADYYWLAFISYIGDSRARELDNYSQADRYLDIVTRLDCHFIEAYWFCAFTVGADEGKPDLAQKIIDRGIAANASDWTLPFIGGFNQYLFAGNDKVAARYYRMAARFPHAPAWLSHQAAILERGIPRIYKQISTWENIYNAQESPLVRQKARETLASLWLSLYRTAPTAELKNKASDALRSLGEHNLRDY
jgi:hypothetical protein